MRSTVEGNLKCLFDILQFNLVHGLLFFRITSDLIPFASHPVCAFKWKKVFKNELRYIGDYIKKHDMRVSMHPDQFTLINSIDEEIFKRSVSELQYHTDILDLMELDSSARIQIHVGGVYGDKQESIGRFIKRYRSLPAGIKARLSIENDERLYNPDDCITVHENTGIPVIFDTLHFACNNNGESMKDAFLGAYRTWSGKSGLPMVDYSSQDKTKKQGAHAGTIDIKEFKRFLTNTKGHDFDIMCEIKDKNISAVKALKAIKGLQC